MCGGLEGGREAVQGAVVGQGQGERGGRGVVGDVRGGGLSLRWSAASATAEAVEAQAAAVVGGQRLGEALGGGVGLRGREGLGRQRPGGLWPGRPGRLRRRGLRRGLRGRGRRLRAGAWGRRRGLGARPRRGVRRRRSGLGLRLGLGRRRRDLRARVLQHHGLEQGLFAAVLALLLAPL